MYATMSTMTCATPKGDMPAPKGKPEPAADNRKTRRAAAGKSKPKKEKIPVPARAPRETEVNAPADVDREARKGTPKRKPATPKPAAAPAPEKPIEAKTDLDGIPEQFLVKNRKPLTAEQQAKLDASTKARAEAAKPKLVAAAKPAKKSKQRGKYDWEAAEALAASGKVPERPDFSAPTHKYYKTHLDAFYELAQKGDLNGIVKYPKKFKTEPYCSSRTPMLRFRDLCVKALKARAKSSEKKAA